MNGPDLIDNTSLVLNKMSELAMERHRVISNNIRDKSMRLKRGAVSLQDRIEIIVPMPAAETNEFIKALRVRVVRPVPAIVPLAKTSRCISGLSQELGDRYFLAPHEFIAARHPCHSAAGRVATGQ